MSIFFAMVGSGDDRRPAFYLTRSAAPAGAVEITDARHQQLLEAQASGRAIVLDARGRPVVDRRTPPSAAGVRDTLRAAIRREAAARINAVSPEWRQINDLREPSETGAVRFAKIDAIRAASGAIEDITVSLPVADLTDFPVATHTLWPEFD